jgi:lipopolysaccharide/colanic/teichoic acid biosynthesis glycosyltransferase
MYDWEKPYPGQPGAVAGNALADEQSAILGAHAVSTPKAMSNHQLVHAVPVINIVGRSSWLGEALYRIFEIIIAGIGLLLGLPLMLLEAALIRWDSPGPVLFFHRRPGRSTMMWGRDLERRSDLQPPSGGYAPDRLYYVPSYFHLVKFRTMYSDARSRFPELYAYDFAPEEFHQQYGTERHDPRVTRIGAILRTLSLDELPNLWSVLVGNMRLVGPRPEAPEVLPYYTPDEMYKFACKPGVTGLAQINGRGLLNWGETLTWDLKYVRTRNVWLDLKIIFITFKYVLVRRGAF